MYMARACQSGMTLESIPAKDRDAMICKHAVMQNGLALQMVPKEFKSLELCRLAVAENKVHREGFIHITPI